MTRTEHLLTILGEECNEVAQRVSKALRFGLSEVYEDHPDGEKLNNFERILQEYVQLQAVFNMLDADLPTQFTVDPDLTDSWWAEKENKVEKFLEYSRKCGTLVDE